MALLIEPDRPSSPFFPFLPRTHSFNDQLAALRGGGGGSAAASVTDSSHASDSSTSPNKRRTVRWNRSKWSVRCLSIFPPFFAPISGAGFGCLWLTLTDVRYANRESPVRPNCPTVMLFSSTSKISLSAIHAHWPATQTMMSTAPTLTVSL